MRGVNPPADTPTLNDGPHTSRRIAIEASIRTAQWPSSPERFLGLAKRRLPPINLATGCRTLTRLTERGCSTWSNFPGNHAGTYVPDGLPSDFRVHDHEVVLVGTCGGCSPGARSTRGSDRSGPRAPSDRRR